MSYDIEHLIDEVVEQTNELVQRYNYNEYDLRYYLGQFATRVSGLARKDEIERIQRNTLDADMDVWSQNDEGQLISLTERYKGLE